jgi:transposase InsO family protein
LNAHVERFNKTIQDDWIDWHITDLKEPDSFNNRLMDYLIFYNTERVHEAFQNKLSPAQFMLQWQERQTNLISQESNNGWYRTKPCFFLQIG